MPGRILHAIKAAKTNNPVILLDEVDKIVSFDRLFEMLQVLTLKNLSFKIES